MPQMTTVLKSCLEAHCQTVTVFEGQNPAMVLGEGLLLFA